MIEAILITMLRESEKMSTEVKEQLGLLTVVDDETTKPLDPDTDPTSRHLQDEISKFLNLLKSMEKKRRS